MRTPYDDRTWPSIARWISAIALISAAHAGGAWFVFNQPPPEADDAGGPPAIMIELAPLAVSQDVEQIDLADGQLSAQADRQPVEPPEEKQQPEQRIEQPEPVQDAVEEPVEPEEIAPLPEEEEPEAASEETPEAEPEPEVVEAEPLPEEDSAEVVLPDEVPFPTARPNWLDERPTTVTRHEQPKRRPQQTQPVARNSVAAAPVATDARRDQVTASPTEGTARSPSISPAQWQSRLNAHLNRFKRPPSGGAVGTARVKFTIDAAGRVTRVQIAGSSGNPSLDQAALDLVRRANPVPAPPAELLRGGSLSLTVPVNYTR